MGRTATRRDIQPGERVLVTGAMGGVGRHIVQALVDAGCEVRAVDLRAPDELVAELVDIDAVEWVQGDLLKVKLAPLVQGCKAVVNCAAKVGLSESYNELVETNVDLIEHLYEACVDAGVTHFVHFSAGQIYEPARGLRDEQARLAPGNAYEETKVEGENVLPPRAESTHWTILRPALVYGPHCVSMSAGLVTLPPILRNFMPLLPGFTGGSRANWCHVEDLASATMAVLGNPRAYEQIFNVGDDTPLGNGEAVTAMAEAYGLPIGPLVPFPNGAVLLAFSPVVDRDYLEQSLRQILRQIWKRICQRYGLESPLRPKLDRNALFYVAEDTVVDAAKLKALGWAPEYVSLRDGITDTVRWYQEHGWVPKYDIETEAQVREQGSFGFSVSQKLDGHWFSPEEAVTRPVQLSVDLEFRNVLTLDFSGQLEGMAWFEGLATNVGVSGTVQVKVLSSRTICFEFGFEDPKHGGHRCELEATFNPLRPFSSMSMLKGRIVNKHGDLVGNVELNLGFAEQVIPLLMSFRPLS